MAREAASKYKERREILREKKELEVAKREKDNKLRKQRLEKERLKL